MMGRGDHSDICFNDAPDAAVNTEAEVMLTDVDSSAVAIRSRHTSLSGTTCHSNGIGRGVTLAVDLASYSAVARSREKLQLNGLMENGLYTEQEKGLLEKSKELYPEAEKDHDRLPGRARRNLILAVLLLANLINYMDRYTIAGVLEEVKNFYSINNGEAGLLQTSFIVSYMILSPVFGYLGDRYNRKYIMAGGIFFWSIVTLAGSFVSSDKYLVFLLMRGLVGVGEASYSTIAPSLIADTVPKSMRTKALSIFYFAIPVGSGMGYIVGSNVAKALGSWQWALRVTPILGVVCTILVLFVVVEPRRGGSDAHSHSTSFFSDVLYLLKHKSFMLLSFGFTCVAFVAGALALWAPLYMHRSMQVQQVDVPLDIVSLIFGIITCVAGLAGVSIGSLTASRLRSVSKKADPLVCAFGLIVGAPFLYLSLCLSRYNTVIPWVMIFIGETLLCLNWALVTDILLSIIIPRRRSTAEACQILLAHALGDAGSPYLVGVVSDYIADSYGSKDLIAEYASLQFALYIPCFVCVLGGGFFLATALFIEQDRKETDDAMKGISKKSSNENSSASFTSMLEGSTPTNETDLTDSDTPPQLSVSSSERSSQEVLPSVLAVANCDNTKSQRLSGEL